MKIRWVPFHKLRRRLFLLCLTVLVVCLLKLFYVRVTLGNSFYVEPYGITVSSHRAQHHEVNCSGIYQLDPAEVGKALEIRRKVIVDLEDDNIVSLTSDCDSFIQTRRYNQVPVTEEELRFPLAYSLVVHKNAPMVERILRAIYSPLNLYCLHYDQKSSPAFIKAMENLAGCLPNLFIASRLEAVQYAHVSRLNADLNCLSDLLGSEVKWKYVINLCGQDFPLRSQAELGEELRSLNGSNMLETSRPSEAKQQRFKFHHELKDVPYSYRRMPVKTTQPKAPAPHSIQVFIGSAYFVLSREFVSYVTRSPVVRDFLEWSADTYSPDEHFWATLVRLPGIPGHIPAGDPDVTDLQSKTRLVKWNYLEGSLYPPCTGVHMRSVCIFGVAELRWLLNYGHWFANKFDSKVDPVLIKCLEEMLEEKGRQQSGVKVPAPSP